MKIAVATDRTALPSIFSYIAEHRDAKILCLDFWTERVLTRDGVPFESGRELFTHQDEEWSVRSQDIARGWYQLPSLSFLEHEGIHIGEALAPMVEMYLPVLFHYVRAFQLLKKSEPDAELYIPVHSAKSPTTGPLAQFEGWAVYDAACMAGFAPTSNTVRTLPQKHLFPRSSLQSFLIRAYNSFVSIVPKRTFRIYASEYWSHIAPILTYVPEAELVLMESGQLPAIGWRSILRHRIRVRHPGDTSRTVRRKAMQKGMLYLTQWKSVREDVAHFLRKQKTDVMWEPVLDALDYLVAYAPRVIADIEGLKRIYEEERPRLVVQRASIGGRLHHFFLMARVAEHLGIPSVELQHAGAIFDPHSVHSRLETTYLASYGDVEREEYAKNGYAPERIRPVGSARLIPAGSVNRDDILRGLGLDPLHSTVFVAIPSELAEVRELSFTSYAIADFLRDLRHVKDDMPNIQFICKFRKGTSDAEHRAYIEELFPEGGVAVTDEDPGDLIAASDVITSGNSTILYETLINRRPLVLFPWKPWDYSLHVYTPSAPFAASGEELSRILTQLFNDKEYAEKLHQSQEVFRQRHSFDTNSALASATLFREIAKI